MKTRELIMSALVLIALGGCAAGKYVPRPNEESYGTWLNEKRYPQKMVLFAGGFKQYTLKTDTAPTYSEGTLEIQSKWKGAEGNIWYKFHVTDMPGGEKFQCLYKISKSGTVLERVYNQVADFDPKNFPTSIDLKSGTYSIFFRSPDQQ